MTKKNITTQILALLALACLALAPAEAQASEVTGTLSSDGTVTINQDEDNNLSGEVVEDEDNNLSGTVTDDDNGGSGGGGGGGGIIDDDDDENGGGGAVLGAQTTPLIPQTGGFLPTVLGANTAPGLPNTGEPFQGGTSATVGWTVVLASVLATLGIAFLLYSLLKEAKRGRGLWS